MHLMNARQDIGGGEICSNFWHVKYQAGIIVMLHGTSRENKFSLRT